MIRRRDVLGAGSFALLASATSAGAIGFRQSQHSVPTGRDRVLTHLPPQAGGWQLQPARDDMVDPVEVDIAFASALKMYDRVIEADYVSPSLPRIMLNIAYKREIRQEERFHWPEFCYSTQGFQVSRLPPFALGGVAPGVLAARFIGERAGRKELVGYLIRIGDSMTSGSVAVRSALFRQSLSLHIPDGVMFRASLTFEDLGSNDPAVATKMLGEFFDEMISRCDLPLKRMLIT